MAQVRPFRALRYDTAKAGPLEALVAPPYDVISPEERARYLARSPYNVVHLTLPDSEDEAARELAQWRAQGVLVEEEPAAWVVSPLRIEPYENRVVLPHERTHAGPKEGRLRLLRATRTQLEPIFLLYDGDPPFERPAGAPAMDVEEGGVRT